MKTKINKYILIILLPIFINNCGTIYNPQVLNQARGISFSEGQEQLIIDVVPLTSKVIKKSNEDDYIRRVIDAGDLSRAARLISIDKAIDEKLPKNNDPGPYILGIGDVLDISQILNGNLVSSNPTLFSSWETVSNVERTLTWGVTVRDRSESNPNGMGQISQDVKKIFVSATAGPFRIISNDSNDIVWKSGSNQKIIWDVANTDKAPINTDKVSIFLSVDGGENFSIALAENIPNNGEAYIIVPGLSLIHI